MASPKSMRKVPTQERSKATVTFIVKAARRELEKSGLQGFNVKDVATTAGVSVASLYQYFPTREATLTACEEAELTESAGEAAARFQALLQVEKKPTVEAMIGEFVAMALTAMRRSRRLFGMEDMASRKRRRFEIVDVLGESCTFALKALEASGDERFQGRNTPLVAQITLRAVLLLCYQGFESLEQRGVDPEEFEKEVARMITMYILGDPEPQPRTAPRIKPNQA